ncbi:MAG: Rieske (2Fe-2S) protein [Rhodospirillales bacterium]
MDTNVDPVPSDWHEALPFTELERDGARVVKLAGRQIALFHRGGAVYACNNHCPHEGYPLKEGTLSGDCVLTCNWHNWKFDLRTGANLNYGDNVRIYPVEVRDGGVWVDLADPPAEQQRAAALAAFEDAFDEDEFYRYDRLAREIARFEKAGGDPLDAVAAAIGWTHARLPDGMTHAHAAAPDWLRLRDRVARTPGEKLMPVLEVAGHLNWDTLKEPRHPYAEAIGDWDADAYVAAVDGEDEDAAVAILRGGLHAGLGWDDVEPAFARAALAHYQDFGHSAIYVLKTRQLLDYVGADALEPLTLALTRALVQAWREDLIPEFRAYHDIVGEWQAGDGDAVDAAAWTNLNADKLMRAVAGSGARPEVIYDALVGLAARHLLGLDLKWQDATNNGVRHNTTWLTITHELTFANACRTICERYPELWPQALLQIACFVGRNVAYILDEPPLDEWRVTENDIPAFFERESRALLDHGQFEYIVTAHLVKTLTAIEDEVTHAPDAAWRDVAVAGLNRFLHSPLKRRHSLRTANQAIEFVTNED